MSSIMKNHYKFKYIPKEEREGRSSTSSVSMFNAVLQLLGCIVGTYMSYKTESALAFPMFYVPFSLVGMIFNDF